MGYWLQVPGECEERLSASVAPEHLRGSCQPGSIRCGASPVVLPRLRRADVASTVPPAPRLGYWLQMPGECEERISDSVAPEHFRGSWQPGSMHRVAGRRRWVNAKSALAIA